MANIDTTLIEGYDTMTAEEKVAALEKFSYEDHSAELAKIKSALDKSNSEAADWKRKHHDLLDADERKRQQEAEEREAMLTELEALRKEKIISGYKASYMANGYTEELADKAAQALADGDMDTIFAIQRTFQEAHDKALRSELLGNTPKPQGGGDPGGNAVMTKETLKQMSVADRAAWAKDHPDEYKTLYGG